MKTQHTPGPWSSGLTVVWQEGSKKVICQCDKQFIIEETKANARLIAAAPELLEQLESLADAANRGSPDLDIYINDARRIIEKAKGE